MNAYQAAMDHAAMAIPTFPCSASKRPMTANGFHAATMTPDPAVWADAALVGIPTGAASGWTVLDIDPRHGGDIWLAEHEHHLPPTRRVATRSGGSHLYFAAVAGIRCSAGRIAPGVDIRSDGGYVVDWGAAGFPVQHADTTAEMPGWLVRAAAGPRVHDGGTDRPELDPPPSVDAVVALLDRLPNNADTSRDEYVRVLLSARGCIETLGGDGEADISEAAVGWAARWPNSPGYDAEADRWESDFAHRDAQLSGWPHLLAAARRLGLDTTAEQAAGSLLTAMQDAPAPGGRAKRMRDRILHPADCVTLPGRGYLIKGLIAAGDVAALIGAPGCGKSTLAATICYAVAQNRLVFGMRTKPGAGVLYVAGEDMAGLRQRVHALRLQFGDAPGFALVDCENLNDSSNAADLLDTVRHEKPALVVIDTLNAAWAGIEENSSEAMGGVVALARRISATGAAVLLVHHVAKNGDGTPRGHSSLNGTLDACLLLGAADDGGVIRGKLSKNRNGSLDIDMAFRQSVVTLGIDDDGDAITTTVAAEVCSNAPTRLPKLTERESQAVAILAGLSTDGGPVAEDEWFAACDDARVSTSPEPRNRRTAISRIMRSLIENGSVAAENGTYRLTHRVATCNRPATEENRVQPDATEQTRLHGSTQPMQPDP